MRTLISLLLLACFAWTQASVADCPMAPAPVSGGRHDPRNPPSPAQHLGGGCGVLMTCGAAAAPPLASSLAALDAPRPDRVAAGRDAYASPTLSTDPPPPRIALRS